ncbi:carboxypeptidase-like regulatory domain-containing protein [Winogradskyella litorisediminis]|uniref:Carboxypeptidase-like regulatory domain-containing protein n=1 Tax=Winogradskyella litorisediminis TaxID=1156618 RepID=A0ABW3NCF7_9FLAO
MKSELKLSIASPCTENFSNFSPTEKGGFCDSCSKEVIDFTKMKDERILEFFKNSNENTCGVFNRHQLKTYDQKNETSRTLSLVGKIGIACFALLSFGTITAQNTKTKAETSISQQNGEFTVKGTVKEDGLVIPGVNIILQGTKIGTVTDFDGNFLFPKKLKKGDVLIFSYVGYQSQRVVISDKNAASNISLKLDMELDPVIIMGSVSSKKVFKSRH